MSGGEIIVIILVILLLFGTKSLPSIARGLGKGMNEFRKATEDLKKEINVSTDAIKNDLNVNTNEITNLRDKIKKEIEENVNFKDDIKKGNAIKPETFTLKKSAYPPNPELNKKNESSQDADYSI